MRTNTKKLLAIALVAVMMASAGCTGWGTDGPADSEPNQSDDSNASDDLEETQNETNTSDSEDNSDGDTNAGDGTTDSDATPDDSDSSSGDSSSRQSDGDSGAEDSEGDGSSASDSESQSGSDSDQKDSKESDDSKHGDDKDGQKDSDTSDGSDGDDGGDGDNTTDEPETSTLTVTVTDHTGDPVTNETVHIVTYSGGANVASGTTDENGEVQFELEDGDYEVGVSAPDKGLLQPSDNRLVTIDGEDVDYTVELQPAGGTNELTVTVENHNGEPVENASVSVATADGGEEVASGTTDADGIVTFDVEDGEYDISADHEEARGGTVSRIAVDGDTEDTLTLDTSEGLATGIVKVVDQNGDPVEGEEVTLWPPGAVDEEATETRETDENGEVRIELLAGDPSDVVMFDVEVRGQIQTLAIMADAYTGVQEVVFEVDDSEPETTITVDVVDDETGEPIDGGEISIIFPGWGYGFSAPVENGTATFETSDEGIPTVGDDGGDTAEVELTEDVEGYEISEERTNFTMVVNYGEDNTHTLNLVKEGKEPVAGPTPEPPNETGPSETLPNGTEPPNEPAPNESVSAV